MEQLVYTFGEAEENMWISKLACRNRRGRKASIQLISPSILLGKDQVLLFDLQSKKKYNFGKYCFIICHYF